jgi:hypothetical protein
MSSEPVRLIPIRCIPDPRGVLGFAEEGNPIPFPIERVFFVHSVPEGQDRGGHANLDEQVLIMLQGQVTVSWDDGKKKGKVTLSDSTQGLFLPRMVWRELEGFSGSAVLLSLCSLPYADSNYIREYADFVKKVSHGS